MRKSNYYSVLTHEVITDGNLSPFQQILYAELTALSKTHKYCFASNQYLATRYNKSKLWISESVSSLARKGYLKVSVEARHKRKIWVRENFSEIPENTKCLEYKAKKIPKDKLKNHIEGMVFPHTEDMVSTIDNSKYNNKDIKIYTPSLDKKTESTITEVKIDFEAASNNLQELQASDRSTTKKSIIQKKTSDASQLLLRQFAYEYKEGKHRKVELSDKQDASIILQFFEELTSESIINYDEHIMWIIDSREIHSFQTCLEAIRNIYLSPYARSKMATNFLHWLMNRSLAEHRTVIEGKPDTFKTALDNWKYSKQSSPPDINTQALCTEWNFSFNLLPALDDGKTKQGHISALASMDQGLDEDGIKRQREWLLSL